jgi:hypothetical protein
MKHQLSLEDYAFCLQFESGLVSPADFNHQAHVRLAYIYLCENTVEIAYCKMRDSIQALLAKNGLDTSKYHETLTRAWVMAVRHFMANTQPTNSASDFILNNPRLLDTKIMLTHYSESVLFTEQARHHFIEPDLETIPQYA